MPELWPASPVGTKVRTHGWVLVLLGGFLVIFMGGPGIVLAGIIAGSGLLGTTVRFTGGPEDVLLMIAVFGLVIAFGLACIAGGAWQIWYGKRNTKVTVIIFVIAGILFVIGNAVRFLASI